MNLLRGGFANWREGTGTQEVSAQNPALFQNFWVLEAKLASAQVF